MYTVYKYTVAQNTVHKLKYGYIKYIQKETSYILYVYTVLIISIRNMPAISTYIHDAPVRNVLRSPKKNRGNGV